MSWRFGKGGLVDGEGERVSDMVEFVPLESLVPAFTLTGPPITPEMQMLFGPYAGGGAEVVGIAQLTHGLVVSFGNGLQLTFAPIVSGGVARDNRGLGGATIIGGCGGPRA